MNEVVDFMILFPEFRAPSWDGWRDILKRITRDIREVHVLAGRGGGKSRAVSMVGLYHATRRHPRAAGEAVVVGIIAPSRAQALVTFRYLRALLRSVPVLAALIVRETADTIWLSTGCVIEVISASAWSPRGRTFGAVIFEEACFFDADEAAANPIGEMVRAVRPRLVAGGRLYFVSSPAAPVGPMHEAEQHPSSCVLFVRKATLELNPGFDRAIIEQAYRDDPVAAATEFGAAWRKDGPGVFLLRGAIEAATVSNRRELPPRAGRTYHGFVDLSSGAGGDSATLAITHGETKRGNLIAVLDLVREVPPPFAVTDVCREFARTLRTYDIGLVVGDRFGSEFAASMMQDAGVTLWPSNRSASELYLELLPAVNARRVELLDVPKLQAQLTALRRRTGRAGREHVDHPSGLHDDLANVVAGVVAEVLQPAAVAGGVGQAVTDDSAPDFVPEPSVAPSWMDYMHRGVRGPARGGRS